MKRIIKASVQKPYLYILTHGLGGRVLPKGISIVQGWDLPNGYTVVALDRFLSTKELQEYDIPSETTFRNKLASAGYDYYWDGGKFVLFDTETEEVLPPFRDDSRYFS